VFNGQNVHIQTLIVFKCEGVLILCPSQHLDAGLFDLPHCGVLWCPQMDDLIECWRDMTIHSSDTFRGLIHRSHSNVLMVVMDQPGSLVTVVMAMYKDP